MDVAMSASQEPSRLETRSGKRRALRRSDTELASGHALNPLLARIVETAPVGIIVVDEGGRMQLVNAEAERVLGYRQGELAGRKVELLVPRASRSAHAWWRQSLEWHEGWRLMARGRDINARRKDGSLLQVEVALRPLQIMEQMFVVVSLVDVSERNRLDELTRRAGELLERRVSKRTAELEAALHSNQCLLRDLEAQRRALEQLSREDPLTGLGNRRELERRLQEEVGRAERWSVSFTVAVLDIDHFKRINDGFGHGLGDQVLQQVAALIRRHVRDTDLVARHGGEEFALVMSGNGGEPPSALCERIREAFHGFDWRSLHPALSAPVTISVGLAHWRPGMSARELLEEADQRLYQAKREGRDRVVAAESAPDLAATHPADRGRYVGLSLSGGAGRSAS